MRKLKQAEIPQARRLYLSAQDGRCPLCERPIVEDDAVLDHDHVTGIVRATLHRGCNAMLGKIENGRRLYKLSAAPDLSRFLNNVSAYIAIPSLLPDSAIVLHPLHKTDEDKKALRKKRAKAKRLLKKGTA